MDTLVPHERISVATARYTPIAQWMHWLTALLMFAIIVVGWHMTTLPRGAPTRDGWFTFHRSLGLTILALTVARLIWRAIHRPPPLPGALPRLEELMARASHWLLYFILLAMPISGYLSSAAGNHDVILFGLLPVPRVVPLSPGLAAFGSTVHILMQWAVYAVIALHVAATGWHVVVRRDGVLDRMLPPQTNA